MFAANYKSHLSFFLQDLHLFWLFWFVFFNPISDSFAFKANTMFYVRKVVLKVPVIACLCCHH